VNFKIYYSVLVCMGLNITRVIYDDIMVPLIVEMKNYDKHGKMELSRRIQVIIGLVSDFFNGTLLLYLFYNNAREQLKKRMKIRHRIG
jgi:hypothetical protein